MTRQPTNNVRSKFFIGLATVFLMTAFAFAFTGCTTNLPPLISFAHFEKPIDPFTTLSNNTAVIYGRFAKGTDFAWGNQIALRVRNADSGREWLLQFRSPDSLYGVFIPPGHYQVVGFVATFMERRTVGKRSFRSPPTFEVRPNSITYIGDYRGATRMAGLDQQWYVSGVSNNFSQSTEYFQTEHPRLPKTAYTCATEMLDTFVNMSLSPIQRIKDPAHIDGAVKPYFDSVASVIDVGEFSKGLGSTNESEFLATISKMKQSWPDLKFPEMYIAAIQLYDRGYRKEAVYWFYTAQYRGRFFGICIDQKKMRDLGDPAVGLLHVHQAFEDLVGPYIYAYAFGDVTNYLATIQRVRKESDTMPDMIKLYPDVNLKKQSDWQSGNRKVQHGLDELITLIKKRKDNFNEARVEQGIDTKFANLSNKELTE